MTVCPRRAICWTVLNFFFLFFSFNSVFFYFLKTTNNCLPSLWVITSVTQGRPVLPSTCQEARSRRGLMVTTSRASETGLSVSRTTWRRGPGTVLPWAISQAPPPRTGHSLELIFMVVCLFLSEPWTERENSSGTESILPRVRSFSSTGID